MADVISKGENSAARSFRSVAKVVLRAARRATQLALAFLIGIRFRMGKQGQPRKGGDTPQNVKPPWILGPSWRDRFLLRILGTTARWML